MKDRHIAQLEAQLERLIEGAFARFFGKKIRAQDIALQLARAMENGLKTSNENDPRFIAPDSYKIVINSETAINLLREQPDLSILLSKHMVELASNAGYRLDTSPIIDFEHDNKLSNGEIRVTARHMATENNTNLFKREIIADKYVLPKNPQFAIGNRIISLEKPLLNIGRSLDNDIVLEDSHTSRHHAQLRLRFGRYTLFDIKSRYGTFVNDIRVSEHTLRSGDVIKIGEIQLVYLEDDDSENADTSMHKDNPDRNI